MNLKKLLGGGIVGEISFFLLGWITYGILLKDYFPQQEGTENLTFIFLGSMCYGFLFGWIFQLNEGIGRCVSGIKAGFGIGLFTTLYFNFFQNMNKPTLDFQMMVIDTLTMLIISALMGAIVAVVNGKLS